VGRRKTEEAWTAASRLSATAKRQKPADTRQVALIEDLFRQHYQHMVRSLTFIALDREVAADAAQEAFVELFRKWDRVSGYEDPTAWLYRVAIYKCRDHRRALTRARRMLERIAGQEASNDGAAWFIESDFLAALGVLPRRQRVAACLHYVAGLSLYEVAQAMNVSEGTAKTHLFRARERLRKELEVNT
jgi:RNA polymerase sigma-70 factor (ECF subfamily)